MNDVTFGELVGYVLLGIPLWLVVWWGVWRPFEAFLLLSERGERRYLGNSRKPR